MVWSIKITTSHTIVLYYILMQSILYRLQLATMDAILATIVANLQARFHNGIEVATNKLITCLLYGIILNPSTAASANTLDGSPLRWI